MDKNMTLYHEKLPKEGRKYSEKSASILLGKNIGFSTEPFQTLSEDAINKGEDSGDNEWEKSYEEE